MIAMSRANNSKSPTVQSSPTQCSLTLHVAVEIAVGDATPAPGPVETVILSGLSVSKALFIWLKLSTCGRCRRVLFNDSAADARQQIHDFIWFYMRTLVQIEQSVL